MTVGPAATANSGLEIDTATGGTGNGALIDSVFLEASRRPGWRWSAPSWISSSYGHVKVTSKRLRVTPKGIDGKPQRDGDKPCGPFVLKFER